MATRSDAFSEKVKAIQKETGYTYSILAKDFDAHLAKNTLFAGWFDPGTCIATIDTPAGQVKLTVEGPLDAVLLDSEGQAIHQFDGKFEPFKIENIPEGGLGEINIESDIDIEALADEKHASGCRLIFARDNVVVASIDNPDVSPITIKEPSVARCITKNVEVVQELVRASGLDKTSREEALAEAQEQILEDQIDPPNPPEPDEAGTGDIVPSDIPHYFDTEEGKKALAELEDDEEDETEETEESDVFPEPVKEEVKRAEKKTTKKASKETKKTTKAKAKTKDADEEAVGRFDLLPLDIVGRIVSGDIDNGDDREFLSIIEDYKKTKDEEALLVAAMHLAEYYGSPTDFVTALAVLVEKEAEEHGEDAWKEKDTVRCLNEAIRNYLIFLKAGNEDDILIEAAWSLICAAKKI